MVSITIAEKSGASKQIDFQQNEISIGRVQGNDVVLPRSNVSKKHARIEVRDNNIFILDLESTNGTIVNGKRITAPQMLRSLDKVQIGDFSITVIERHDALDAFQRPSSDRQLNQRSDGTGSDTYERKNNFPDSYPGGESALDSNGYAAAEPKPARSPVAVPRLVTPVRPPTKEPTSPIVRSELDQQAEQYAELLGDIRKRVLERIDLRNKSIEELNELRDQTDTSVREIVGQTKVPSWANSESLIKEVEQELLGLGPLDDFFADDSVSEIMVNNARQIFLESDGQINQSSKIFSSDAALMDVIERLLAPLGKHVSERSPMVDARLVNGAHVNIVIPPLAMRGPSLTIRKPKQQTMNIDQLVAFGTLTRSIADFLDMCIAARKNVVISGMYGSGRTTLLNCLAARIPEGERIITIEDEAELQLPQAHCVALAARAPDSEGVGQITIRDLVRNSLRMKPTRIVLGECVGDEILDIVQAMNAGHNFLFTLHANSPIDCLAKLENMVLTSGVNLPLRAVREQIASAVNVIVQLTTFVDGSHKISLVTEISGMEADVINMQDIFYYKQDPMDDTNEVKGTFITTGIIPRFYDDLKQRGISADLEIFRE